MNWRETFLQAMKDPEELRRMAELARQSRVFDVPRYDYKTVQSEGREEDDA